MFATLNLERDPLKLADIPNGMLGWAQVVGSFALIGLVIWVLVRFFRHGAAATHLLLRSAGAEAGERLRSVGWGLPPRWGALFRLLALGAVGGYLAALALYLVDRFLLPAPDASSGKGSFSLVPYANGVLTLAAVCALLTVCLPFFLNLLELRWRRIWGIARLSAKEAIRRKVLYVFAAMLLVFLFLNWFVPSKRETQLQNYVTIAFWPLTFLMLVSSALIAAFGIPTDIKQQTIHTVVTKPVERFEIVLGRFLGYTLLMSAVLLVLTTLCLFYVLRGINPDAAAESLKARQPVYGELHFLRIASAYTDREDIEEVKREDRELNVGREWDYHKYIPGVNLEKEIGQVLQAVWYFDDVPSVLTRRPRVRCEYKFDIYRQSKGKEGEAVRCSFFFHTRYFNSASNARNDYANARKKLLAEGKGTPDEIDDQLAEQFGYHEVQAAKVIDYHTLHIDLPGGLFRNARNGPPGGGVQAQAGAPLLTARVRCDSPSQFLGMARYDIYFREDDFGESDSSKGAFAWNFYKGTLGLWMRMCLVIGLCVCLSTELSGIITFLLVSFLYGLGLARGLIEELAQQGNVYGGPLEASYRLFGRKTLAMPLEDTTLKEIAQRSDEVFRWNIRWFIKLLPDIDRYSFTDHVANGFDVGLIGQDLLPTLLMLLGYLLPCALLAFYLIKSREIAGAH
jgi:hypothetical protein